MNDLLMSMSLLAQYWPRQSQYAHVLHPLIVRMP